MKTITIKIVKKSVMGVVEGLSATIAQHNPEVDFQTIWASDAEEAKLDIYYREAITDLENFLAKFTSSTTQQFDLQALADDFSITFTTLAYWPPRLSGLLTNLIQNYLVHAIMAGWLSDFPDMNHTDYASMGVSDIDAIKEALLKKNFSFAEAERNADDAVKDKSSAMDAGARNEDAEAKAHVLQDATSRSSDSIGKDGTSPTATNRSSDEIEKVESMASTCIRGTDATDKQGSDMRPGGRSMDAEAKPTNGISTSSRKEDNNGRSEPTNAVEARNEDNACQYFHHEHVDWSGGRPPYELR